MSRLTTVAQPAPHIVLVEPRDPTLKQLAISSYVVMSDMSCLFVARESHNHNRSLRE